MKRLYTQFQCSTMPGTGHKVCGGWVGCVSLFQCLAWLKLNNKKNSHGTACLKISKQVHQHLFKISNKISICLIFYLKCILHAFLQLFENLDSSLKMFFFVLVVFVFSSNTVRHENKQKIELLHMGNYILLYLSVMNCPSKRQVITDHVRRVLLA